MVDIIQIMQTIETHLDQMKQEKLIEGYELELKDSGEETITWNLWTW